MVVELLKYYEYVGEHLRFGNKSMKNLTGGQVTGGTPGTQGQQGA